MRVVICVSLRTAASAKAPSSPILFQLRLQMRSRAQSKRVNGADTKANTLVGGLPQDGDPRLLEDGGERRGALCSNVGAPNTASEGQDGDGERVGVSMGVDTKANTLGRRRTRVW